MDDLGVSRFWETQIQDQVEGRNWVPGRLNKTRSTTRTPTTIKLRNHYTCCQTCWNIKVPTSRRLSAGQDNLTQVPCIKMYKTTIWRLYLIFRPKNVTDVFSAFSTFRLHSAAKKLSHSHRRCSASTVAPSVWSHPSNGGKGMAIPVDEIYNTGIPNRPSVAIHLCVLYIYICIHMHFWINICIYTYTYKHIIYNIYI